MIMKDPDGASTAMVVLCSQADGQELHPGHVLFRTVSLFPASLGA